MTRVATFLAALCLGAAASLLRGQAAELPPDTLSLADLSALRPRGNASAASWRIAAGAAADRQRAGAVTTTAGTGVLVNLAPPGQGADLFTAWEHGDLELELDVMMPKGGNSGLYFQGRYELQLFDSWGTRRPTFADMGGIYAGAAGRPGVPPRVNASRAPGLWQHLAVRFQAPRFDAAGRKVSDARFVRVELNGVVIHENVRVPGPTLAAAFEDERPTGPLMIQGDHGPVAVRRVTYKRFGGERVQLSALRYRAWQGDFAGLPDATAAAAAAREGAADGITSALAGAPDKFALTFDGTMRVPVAGSYLFDLGFDWVDDDPQFKGTVVGGGRLTIDGREVLRHEGRLPNTGGRVTLSAGEHPFTLAFYKMRPWTNRSGVLLFVEGPGVERQALHAERAPDLPGAITVEPPGGEVLVLRSFVRVGDGKRTHAASVGDGGAGVHYSVDLASGALLQAWRGPFADATEMWHDRGNDQLLRPRGSVLALGGAPALAWLPDDAASWPDSLTTEAGFAFRGYALEQGGRPAFLYRLRDVEVEDRPRPADDGASLRRELKLRAPDATTRLFVRLASGTSVRPLPDGSYLVDDARYYVAPDRGTPVVVRATRSGGQELVAPVRFRGGEASVAYTIIW